MAKTITVKQAISLIKNNDIVVLGMAGAEPKACIKSLHQAAEEGKHVTVTNCLPMEYADYISNEDLKSSYSIDSWFFGSSLRKSFKQGNISFIPNHLHLAGVRRFEAKHTHVYIGAASLPDKHGFISLSLSNVYEKRAIEQADTVILEINPNMPRTFGDLNVHIDTIDYIIETDYMPPVLPDAEPNEKDKLIGNHIAALIPDGACLQLGIGGIPNAVASALTHKKNLGIHTEMFTTGLMKLIKAGAVNGSLKQTHVHKHVCCFALGTQELYDFLDDNPSVLIMDGNYVNDPYVIGKNNHQMSINTTIEIDLTGQCASESIGTRQFSGTGGQADTAIGAQNSYRGKSFITLYSTAMVRIGESDERKEVSKIVPTLKPGAGVTLSRNDVDYVVTEYGIAHLRGLNIKERAEALINIAHPKFRDELSAQAKALYHL